MATTDEQDRMVEFLADRADDGCVQVIPAGAVKDSVIAYLTNDGFREFWQILPDGDARGTTRASGIGFVTGGSSSEKLTLDDVYSAA